MLRMTSRGSRLGATGSAPVAGQDCHGRHRGGATDIVGQCGPGSVDLILGFAPQLIEQLIALRYAGGARGMTLGLQSATGIDRNRTTHVVLAGLDQFVSLEPLSEAEILATDQFDTGEAVVDFG